MNKKQTQIAGVLFFVYALLMLWLLFGQRMGHTSNATYWQRLIANLNLQPLDTVRRYLWVLRNSQDPDLLRHAVVNLVGNVVMFLPLGNLTPSIWGKMQKFRWHFLYMVLIILAIEVLQLFTLLGSCDVDDLILNLVGTTLGYIFWKIVSLLGKKKK